MCILLWTLPSSNHPRFKFVLASNRDEYLERETSRANFWDLDSVLSKAIRQSSYASSIDTDSSDTAPVPAPTTSQRPSPVGVLTGQDLQPNQAINYTIQQLFSFSSSNQEQQEEQEQLVLTLDTKDIPGTWLGMTTHGDFVALTNFRESMEYMAMKRDPKLSRGKVCGEFLVTMAAAHHKEEEDEGNEDQDQDRAVVDSAHGSETGSGDVSGSADEIVNGSGSTEKNWNRSTKESRRVLVGKNQAEKWIRRRAVGWEDEFEGLNLLVVQNAGDHQVVGGNRLGSELIVFNNNNTPDDTITGDAGRIEEGSVVGVSNSVFTKPWTKVKLGVKALENVLNQSINLFGTASRASYTSNNSNSESDVDDDTREIAWLVINMLTLLRTITQPFPEEDSTDSPKLLAGLSERVFVPRIALGGMEYGTRSSTIALFGREEGGVAVFVEKVWYSDKDVVTGERTAYAPDSAEGLHWWQGRIGQPRQQWRLVVGDDLERLLQSARDIRPQDHS